MNISQLLRQQGSCSKIYNFCKSIGLFLQVLESFLKVFSKIMFSNYCQSAKSKEKRFVRKRSVSNHKQVTRSLSSGNFRSTQSGNKFYMNADKFVPHLSKENQILKIQDQNKNKNNLQLHCKLHQNNLKTNRDYFYESKDQEIHKLKNEIVQLKQKNRKLQKQLINLQNGKQNSLVQNNQAKMYEELYELRKTNQGFEDYITKLLEQNYKQRQQNKKLNIEIDLLHRKIAEKNHENHKKNHQHEHALKQKYFSILESYKQLNKQFIRVTLKLKKYQENINQPMNQISLNFSQSSYISKNSQKLQS